MLVPLAGWAHEKVPTVRRGRWKLYLLGLLQPQSKAETLPGQNLYYMHPACLTVENQFLPTDMAT